MLKTSPSVNTSPNPLRYAASRSPHTSPRQLTDKLRHSPSTMSPAVRNTMQSIRSPPIGEPTQNAAAAIAAPKPPSVAATTTDASQTAHQLPTTAAVPDELLRSPVKRRSDDANAAPNTADTLEEVDEVDQDDELQRSKRHRGDVLPEKVLPSRYDLCPVDDMVELIAHMLGELISTNDAIRISTGGLTRFHSRTAPGISVRDYLHRLAKHATISTPLLLCMVYYIDRLCAMYPEFTINTLTVHRFLITAATVAAKGLSDSFWNNTTYARVGGVRLAELKLLELEFLYRVDWRIVPNPDVLVAYYQGLVERTPGYSLEGDGDGESGNDSASSSNTMEESKD